MDGSYQLLAAQYVRKQTRQLIGQLDGVRQADDIEFVHRARVASRRLRAALRIFDDCFASKKLARWRREIRRLTKELGAARDKDVQIDFVGRYLAELRNKSYRPGIARLLLRLEQGRQAIQPEVVEAVERFQRKEIAEEMLAAARKTRSKLKKRKVPKQSDFLFRKAEKHICARLNELMQFEDGLEYPDDQQQHHALRIAGKRLRYTMEICQPVYQGRLDEFIGAVKRLQTLLGDVHDCDVWVADLAQFLEEERRRTVVYFGHDRAFPKFADGIEFFRQERQSRRQELFAELVAFWHELDHAGVWERLVHTVQYPTTPVEPEAPSDAPRPKSASQPAPAAAQGNGKASAGPVHGDGGPRHPRTDAASSARGPHDLSPETRSTAIPGAGGPVRSES
jgi:CHAD domain-containing protein